MKKIETTLVQAHATIRALYKEDEHHFIAMNGLDLGENKLEVQWFFANYAPPGDVTMVSTVVSFDDILPTIRDVVASSWVAEAEFVDLFGVKIEGHVPGFMLETDSPAAPLRRTK